MKKKAWTIVRNGYAVSIGVYFVIKQNYKFYCFSQDQMLLKVNKPSCILTFYEQIELWIYFMKIKMNKEIF